MEIWLLLALGVSLVLNLYLLQQVRSVMKLADVDSLTGLGNRRAFDRAVGFYKTLLPRDPKDNRLSTISGLACLVVDIDYFKQVNDRFGHEVGDEVLREVAKTIQATLRSSDKVFRYGGEEMVAILPNLPEEQAEVVAEKVRRVVAEICYEHKNLHVTVSIGVSYCRFSCDIDRCFTGADEALYAAKDAGRNRVVCRLSVAG